MYDLVYTKYIHSIFVEQIWSKNSKLSVCADIWYLDQFEFAELNGDAHFFYLTTGNTWVNLVQKIKIVNLSLNLVLRVTRVCGI